MLIPKKNRVTAASADLYLDAQGKRYRIDLNDPRTVYDLFDDITDRDFANQFVYALKQHNASRTEALADLKDMKTDVQDVISMVYDLAESASKQSTEDTASELKEIATDYLRNILNWVEELQIVLGE